MVDILLEVNCSAAEVEGTLAEGHGQEELGACTEDTLKNHAFNLICTQFCYN